MWWHSSYRSYYTDPHHTARSRYRGQARCWIVLVDSPCTTFFRPDPGIDPEDIGHTPWYDQNSPPPCPSHTFGTQSFGQFCLCNAPADIPCKLFFRPDPGIDPGGIDHTPWYDQNPTTPCRLHICRNPSGHPVQIFLANKGGRQFFRCLFDTARPSNLCRSPATHRPCKIPPDSLCS